MSQTTVLSNSHYNLRVTYDITSTQVIFYKIEGMSTDGYESYGNNSTLYLNSSAMMTGTVRFPGNSYYTIWSSSGGWGTSEFAGFFYATSCGGASNLKFWYEFSKPSTKYTFTLKTTTGVASFTGGGTYEFGTSVKTVATASTGYKLSKYVEKKSDGTSSTWTECAGLTTHTDTWVIKRNRTVTVYATPNTYTVTYNANGGSGSMASSTATYNAGFTTRQNTFTKSGYKFAGWNEAADGSGTSWTLSSAGVYESGKGSWKWTYTKNITLYAVWQINKYTIAFNGNGGAPVPSNQTKTYGTNLVLSTVVPKKEATSSSGYTIKYELEGGTLSKDSDTSLKITSYTFNKWKDLSGTLYASGGTYTKNQNDTLTAQWSTSVSYSSITLPEASRPNCKLLGWSTSAGGNVVYTAGQSITPSSNMTLYAVWEGRSVLYKNNGVWVEGLVYVKKNGVWKFGKMYTKQNDSWISN